MTDFNALYSPVAYRDCMAAGRTGPLFDAFPCPDFAARFSPSDGLKGAEKHLPLALVREAADRLSTFAPPPAAKGRRRTEEVVAHEAAVIELACELTYRALYDANDVFKVTYDGQPLFRRQVLGGEWGDPPPADSTGAVYAGVTIPAARGPVSRCRVMAVGKMPGMEESRFGRNMIGKSGRLLRRLANEAGLDVTGWYLSNVCRWPHPDPEASGTIPAEWLKTCVPLLRYEIELVRPEFLFLFGLEALKAIFGNGKTMEASSYRVIDHTEAGHPLKVVCSMNAAAVIRKPEQEEDFRRSIAGMAALVATGSAWTPNTDHLHFEIRTIEQLENMVELVLQTPDSGSVAFDCEWHGLFPGEPGAYLRSVQFSWLPKHAAAVVLHDAGGVPVLWPERERVAALLKKLIEPSPGRPTRVIGHNLNADRPWLLSLGVDLLWHFAQPFYEAVPGDPLTLTGAEETRTQGGFDTILAAHAVREVDEFKLELLGVNRLGMHRYDDLLLAWRASYLRERKMSARDLEGYGDVPGDVLIGVRGPEFPFGIAVYKSYACFDADTTRRLFDYYNGVDGRPGLLDRDQFGGSSRVAFWRAMLATMAFGEFHQKGIVVDPHTAAEQSALFAHAKDRLIDHLRTTANWHARYDEDGRETHPAFNPDSVFHCRELLFGVETANRRHKTTGELLRCSPPDAVLAGVTPHVTTGKRPRLWAEVVSAGRENAFAPSTGKEALMVLEAAHPHVKLLRAVRSVNQALKFVLRPPDAKDPTLPAVPAEVEEEDDDPEFSQGMLSFLLKSDGRVHSQFSQTKETGRASSFSPPLQNVGKSVESVYEKVFKDYEKLKLPDGSERVIIGRPYSVPIRSMIKARPGHKLLDVDWTGAELFMAAVQAGDRNMLEHVERASLPENHPDFYDIHSNVAVKAFRLSCPPTKKGLADAGFKSIRTAAKACVFGTMYGQGADSLSRKARQEGAEVTVREAEQLIDGLFELYPDLERYLKAAANRAVNPRFVVNCFGRRRRFPETDDRQAIGEMKRQSANMVIQGGVADAMNMALHHAFWYRYQYGRFDTHWYDMVLQVHDAAVFEVPDRCVEWVVEEVLPTCMSARVAVWSCDLDGRRNPKFDKPFHLKAPPADVFSRWSVGLTRSELLADGLPSRYALRCDRCSKQATSPADLSADLGVCDKCVKKMAEAAAAA